MARSLRCPRCSTVVTVADGQAPVCPSCGFGGPTPGIPAPAAPAAPAPGPAAPARAAPNMPAPQPSIYATTPPAQPAAGGFTPLSSLPPAYPAQPMARPGAVTLVAVLGYIAAGLYTLVGLALLFGGSFIGALVAQEVQDAEGDVGSLFAAMFVVVGILILALAVLEFFVATGLLRGRNWARVTQLVFSFIGGAFGVLNLLTGNILAIVGLALNVAFIVILLGKPAKAYFSQPRPA